MRRTWPLHAHVRQEYLELGKGKPGLARTLRPRCLLAEKIVGSLYLTKLRRQKDKKSPNCAGRQNQCARL